jgi:hypothetical protein
VNKSICGGYTVSTGEQSLGSPVGAGWRGEEGKKTFLHKLMPQVAKPLVCSPVRRIMVNVFTRRLIG